LIADGASPAKPYYPAGAMLAAALGGLSLGIELADE
jgi:hypothetical protein